MKKIVFAGGCFWGVEEYLSRINGIIETEVGYANGNISDPTYNDICTKNTGFAEVCYVTYDETKVSLKDLLNKFWFIIDPTSINKQGNDTGSQYRTGIYYLDKNDLTIILENKKEAQSNYSTPIVTEVLPLKNYYRAEEYHQQYLKKNPNGYCHIKLD